MRLCITNRFVTAAEMSKLLPTVNAEPYGLPALQSAANHAFVHGNVKSRAALVGWNRPLVGPNGFGQSSDVTALLPAVVPVGVPVLPSTSHGVREARLPMTRVQSPGLEPCRQHQLSRVSVLGLFHGSAASGFSGGFAANARPRATNGGPVWKPPPPGEG